MKGFRFVLLFIFCTMLLSVSAQDHKVNLGFNIAPNIGWMKPDAKNFSSKGSKIGFNWGFISEFNFSENYAFVMGFNVIQNKGILKYRDNYDGYSSTTGEGWRRREFMVKYFQIPTTLKLRTNQLGWFSYYGQIGLGTGFLLSARADDEFSYDDGTFKKNANDNVYDDIIKIRLSLLLEAGVEYKIEGFSTLLFGIHFDNGFTNVLRNDNYYVADVDPFAINNSLALSLGILINP